uniref:Protein DA1 n=1 Tax=Anthurium amnicola TaxID=1678845 RepID=A0A1D1YU44_9ARAE
MASQNCSLCILHPHYRKHILEFNVLISYFPTKSNLILKVGIDILCIGYCTLSLEVEEGICQVLAHMWLDSEFVWIRKPCCLNFFIRHVNKEGTRGLLQTPDRIRYILCVWCWVQSW